jgi:hypothetical protein
VAHDPGPIDGIAVPDKAAEIAPMTGLSLQQKLHAIIAARRCWRALVIVR